MMLYRSLYICNIYFCLLILIRLYALLTYHTMIYKLESNMYLSVK